MPTISVITPAYNPKPEYLTAACESVLTQELPVDWKLEWVVQEDGTTGILKEILPSDSRIVTGMAPHSGAAYARNNAVALASGELIKNLDSDDVLTPGALARDIAILTRNPQVEWTTSRALDLLEDGTTVSFPGDPQEGLIAPLAIWNHWRENDYRVPVHPTTLCIRRDLLLTLGGWTAIPASEDTALVIAANIVSSGYFIREVGLLYRKWPGQTTASSTYRDSKEVAVHVIEQRAHALSRRSI